MPGLASGTTQGTLPWSWYSDPELLRREQERIFQRGWQYAGPAEHAGEPGDYFTCSIGDVPVVVTRDRAGELHALLNVCRHRGSIVAEGRGNRETLQCRYHAWTCQFGPTKRGEGQVEGQFHLLWPVTKLYALPVPPNLAAGPVVPLAPERTRGSWTTSSPRTSQKRRSRSCSPSTTRSGWRTVRSSSPCRRASAPASSTRASCCRRASA